MAKTLESLWTKYGQAGKPDACELTQVIKRRMAVTRSATSLPGVSNAEIRRALGELRDDLHDLRTSKRCRR